MRVLTVNAGSHSLELAVVDPDVAGKLVLAPAGADEPDPVLATGGTDDPPASEASRDALREFLAGLDGIDGIDAVAHRLVHGGDPDDGGLTGPTLLDDDVRQELSAVADLAPLHVPPALDALDAVREALPDVPQVVCVDTAFHRDLPEEARTYPLPASWRAQGVRRFGFHGLSYAWTLERAAALLARDAGSLQVVLAHLGGGSSVCAVKDGVSVDTSMGFTPLEGVPMGSRSGSIDPGALVWLLRHGVDLDELEDGLQHASGLTALSDGLSADTRELVAAAQAGNEVADLALRVFSHRVAKEIAAQATNLDRLDALVLTGEIGWDQPEVREAVCARLGQLDIAAEPMPNLTADGSLSCGGTPVLAVRTREQCRLALEAAGVLA
ncbi:acetate/propionate family kinase [Kineococcus sp. SYSU DK003]|uniref:acetate/propionate family kinase n=1 Tax=Kineococcus sp. SYSU DK003 TaxID=3383124 RepID=UPI003D7D5477